MYPGLARLARASSEVTAVPVRETLNRIRKG